MKMTPPTRARRRRAIPALGDIHITRLLVTLVGRRDVTPVPNATPLPVEVSPAHLARLVRAIVFTLIVFVVFLRPRSRDPGPGLPQIVGKVMPLMAPVFARRQEAAACANEEREHEHDVRKKADGVMPRHCRVEPHRMVLCVEVAVMSRANFEGAASLRAVAV